MGGEVPGHDYRSVGETGDAKEYTYGSGVAAQRLVPHPGERRDRYCLLRVLALDDAGKPPYVDKAVDLLEYLSLYLDSVRPSENTVVQVVRLKHQVFESLSHTPAAPVSFWIFRQEALNSYLGLNCLIMDS